MEDIDLWAVVGQVMVSQVLGNSDELLMMVVEKWRLSLTIIL